MEDLSFDNLPSECQQVLIGSLLGDGGVYIKSRNAHYTEAKTTKHLEYLEWKKNILAPFFGGKIFLKGNKASYYSHVHPLLTNLRNIWYPNGKKIVPKSEFDKLNVFGVAIWFMDDGFYDYYNKECGISVDDFSDHERKIIKRWFLSQGFPTCVTSNSIKFSRRPTDDFLRWIRPHVHKCFTYKLGHLDTENQPKLNLAKVKWTKANLGRREYKRLWARQKFKSVIWRVKYSPSEDDYIKSNWQKLKDKEIAQEFGRTLSAIRQRRRKLGIRKDRLALRKFNWDAIYNDYLTGASFRQIARKWGMSRQGVRYIIAKKSSSPLNPANSGV